MATHRLAEHRNRFSVRQTPGPFMKPIRQLLTAFSCAIALWVFGSVAGVMFDPIRAEFWSASLMWSFLASLLVAPALVVIYDPSIFAPTRTEAGSSGSSTPESSQKSFVEESRTTSTSQGASSSADAEEQLPEWVREQSE